MLSIPEIATQIVDKSLTQQSDDNSRTIFFIGSKSVGKSTLLNIFLEKTDTPRETLVLEYSFGRKSNQKQGLEKSICHVREYGGKYNILKNVLSAIPIQGKFYFCVMVDLSKVKSIWNTLEICLSAMNEVYSKGPSLPELVLICGKYDLFKNYDSEIKKVICTTIRSVALLYNAHVLFYSAKEPQLARRAKEMLHNVGFGSNAPLKEKNYTFTKPLIIPKGTDTWEGIGVAKSSIDQVKSRHLSRISSSVEVEEDISATGPQHNYPEPVLDSLALLQYEELRKLDTLDISIDDYISAYTQ